MIEGSPLGTSVPFGFILFGVEKLMELEFRCPCKHPLNCRLVASMFLGPALLALCVMLFITRPFKLCRRSSCQAVKSFFSCLVPSAVGCFGTFRWSVCGLLLHILGRSLCLRRGQASCEMVYEHQCRGKRTERRIPRFYWIFTGKKILHTFIFRYFYFNIL